MLNLAAMGPMSGKELRTAFWVTLAIILWMTDTLHGVDIGWVTLFIAMAMSLPLVGEISDAGKLERCSSA